MFVSCSNFFNSANLKIKLDEAIEYANSKSFDIRFSGTNGKISPNGIKTYRESDTDVLIFNEDIDWCFTEWQVFENGNLLDDESVDQLIEFDDKNNPETKIKILQERKNLTVHAKCIERPKIVSATPTYDSNGVYRDRRIIIMFDTDMDESSIYYSKDELVKLNILLDDEDLNCESLKSGYKLLKDSSRNDKCYGYQKGDDSSTIVFKNIKITNRKNKNANYLKYYNPPYFDSNDASVLRIDADLKNPPPSATDIIVTINKGIFVLKENSEVSLSADYSWAYYTSGKTDTDVPEFVDFSVQFADDNQTDYKSSNKSVLQTKDNFVVVSYDNKNHYKNNNLRNKRVWVKGGFNDGGSGPASLKWSLTKIDSPYYSMTKDTEVLSGKIDALEIVGANATITNNGTRIDLESEDVPSLEDGLYRLDFTCSDRNELTSTKSYYFVYDVTPPAASTVTHKSTIAKDIVKVMREKNATPDYSHTDIEGVEFNETGDVTKEIKILGTQSNKHTLTIKDYDYYGNCRTTTLNLTAAPKKGMIYYSDGYYSMNYVSGKTPVGVIWKMNSDFSDVRIWDVNEYDGSNLFWGKEDAGPDFAILTTGDQSSYKFDGYFTTKFILENYKTQCVDCTRGWTTKEYYTHTFFYWLVNTKRPNAPSGVEWYFPTVDETIDICGSYQYLNQGFSELKNNGFNAVLQSKNLVTCSPDAATYQNHTWWRYYRFTGNIATGNRTVDASCNKNVLSDVNMHCAGKVDLSRL